MEHDLTSRRANRGLGGRNCLCHASLAGHVFRSQAKPAESTGGDEHMASNALSGGRGISRGKVVVVVALLVAFTLGALGGYLVKALTLPAVAAAAQAFVAQPAASESGSAWNYSLRHSGTQSVEGP